MVPCVATQKLRPGQMDVGVGPHCHAACKREVNVAGKPFFLSHNHNRGICRNCQIHIGIHIYGHMSYMHMISKRTFQNENISFKAKYEVSIVSFKLSFKLLMMPSDLKDAMLNTASHS